MREEDQRLLLKGFCLIMPKKSRLRRLIGWFATLFRSVGALFFPANVKNAFSNVTKNWKEYICFYLAALTMGVGFWTVALCTEANIKEARRLVAATYEYHVEVIVPDEQAYVDMDSILSYEVARENEYLQSYAWTNGGSVLPDGTYIARLVLKDARGLATSLIWVKARILDKNHLVYTEIRESPLFTFEEDFQKPYNTQLWVVSAVWFAFSILMLLLLFLIRLDHFRFIYGVYMTFGADFPRLMGAAGGELAAISLLCFLPSALVGGGIVAALYLPVGAGVALTMRAFLIALGGCLLASFAAVWFPMRKLSRQVPVRHLAASDNTGLVSSPRRSFHLFGGTFPGKYELYGMWRMRKYYIRLVLSAVIFASVFVTGLYAADMVEQHNRTDPREYLLVFDDGSPDEDEWVETDPPETETYEPVYDENGNLVETDPPETEAEPPKWTIDAAEAEELWGDLDLFHDEVQSVPGVSYLVWSASLPGGETSSHLLLKPDQVQSAGKNVVASSERASSGHKWAMNNYAYTAVDKLWIDNMVSNRLCTVEGDPYAVLAGGNQVIVTEDIYNKKTYNFHPGDTIIVAVCEEVRFREMVMDAQELLRGQIRDNKFRYETYTVAAVLRGGNSEDTITFGVTVDNFRTLTDRNPRRDSVAVYMEPGTDMDTVRAAEGLIRDALTVTPGWTVTPTGGYFDASVRGLKNDNAVILTLAVGLLAVSPMIWYFSQILFYRKRRREFAILRAMGASDASFARIHRVAGGILSGAAFLVTILLSLLLNYGIYRTVNTFIPRFFRTESLYYDFSLSLPALVACVAVSILCGYLSCELPYRLYARRDAARDTDEL